MRFFKMRNLFFIILCWSYSMMQNFAFQMLYHVAACKVRDSAVLCDAIRSEQFENWHFSRGYNFWTNDLILILKNPTRPYSCLAKAFIQIFSLNVWWRLMKSVNLELFRSDVYDTTVYNAIRSEHFLTLFPSLQLIKKLNFHSRLRIV